MLLWSVALYFSFKICAQYIANQLRIRKRGGPSTVTETGKLALLPVCIRTLRKEVFSFVTNVLNKGYAQSNLENVFTWILTKCFVDMAFAVEFFQLLGSLICLPHAHWKRPWSDSLIFWTRVFEQDFDGNYFCAVYLSNAAPLKSNIFVSFNNLKVLGSQILSDYLFSLRKTEPFRSFSALKKFIEFDLPWLIWQSSVHALFSMPAVYGSTERDSSTYNHFSVSCVVHVCASSNQITSVV